MRGQGKPNQAAPLQLAAMLLLALLLLSYPWLSPVLQRHEAMGVPWVLLYQLAVWGGFILLVAGQSREG